MGDSEGEESALVRLEFEDHLYITKHYKAEFVKSFTPYLAEMDQILISTKNFFHNYSMGIVIDAAASGIVYVSEYDNMCINYCISVFTSVSSFSRNFHHPVGLAVDINSGTLYVCDMVTTIIFKY